MKLTVRIWIMLSVLILSIILIFNFQSLLAKGVVVNNIVANSSVSTTGLSKGEVITSINGIRVYDVEGYSETISKIFENNNDSVKLVFTTNKAQYIFFSDKVPEVSVSDIPKTNIKTGLDLSGGARALVKPEKELTSSQMDDLISVSSERLNVYGLSDVSIRSVRDLSGNSFMLVEIAGATPNDLESLIGQQGKFEAKIGNDSVFVGGNNDVTYVCRNDASCAGVSSCQQFQGGWFCNYQFLIHLSSSAAERHASLTKNLGINTSNPGYLDTQLDFFVDDSKATSLLISENLKGQVATQIQIQGSGFGLDRDAAIRDAEESMKRMQTILITGSLPYKLEIVKLDSVSPILGKNFTKLILLTTLASLISVSLIVFLRYRNFKASLALLFTSFSELAILLGVASLIRWNLDLPSIVGILVMIGTGVDQQIVILDESRSKLTISLKEKLRWGIYIVLAAYFTTFFSLLPLFWAGAGLLKGFAVTTLIGLTIGVFITRPAYADMLKKFEEKNQS